MGKLMDILLQKPIAFATKDIIKLAKSCEDQEFDKAVLQLFVDFLAKNYEISDDDLEELAESRDGFHQLIMDVYESDDVENVSTEVPYNTFIDSLISELFIVDKLDYGSLSNWVEFFTLIIEEGTIPEEATFKAKSHMMLTFMLPPLAKLVKLSENSESNVIDDLKLAINESIEKIMKNIGIAFRYEHFGIECVKHFTAAIKIHPTLFIANVELFKTILDLDDRTLLALALASLADLCHFPTLHEKLHEFFFPAEPDEGEEVLIDKIFQFLHHRNLKLEVVQFFNALTKIERDFLSEKQRYELFMNIFGKNKKIFTEISSMMASMNVDFWLEIIKMINFYMDPNEIDISQIITSLGSDANPKNFLHLASTHIEDEVTSERAAEMFVVALKMSENPSKELSGLYNAMTVCAANSRVVSILLRAFEDIDKNEIIEHYREHPDELVIVGILAAIFDKTNDQMLEKVIVNVLFIFFSFATETTLKELLELKYGYSRAFKEDISQDPSQANVIHAAKKLIALLECRYWQIMDNSELAHLYEQTFKSLNAENRDFYLHPYFLRLHVNIIKDLWVKIIQKKSLPVHPNTLQEKTPIFKKVLEECYKDENYQYEGRCLAVASLLDLLVMFQPAMADKTEMAIFDDINLPLTKDETIEISETAEILVFCNTKTIKEDIFKFHVVHAYEAFFVNYIKLPSLSSWECFLQHYRPKAPFKTEIEHLMEHALKVKVGVFDKTVAFTILNMSLNFNIDDFRNFYTALEAFVKRHQPDVKERGIRFATICSYVIEKLPKHLKDHRDLADRILPLDYLTIIIKNLEPTYKRNLSEFIKLNGVKLTALEQKKVEAFKNMLKE